MADTRLIQGRYQLLEVIGRGGMGEVWRARDESLGRRVAVKCLKPLGRQTDASLAQVTRERFRREARLAAGLQHRGITVVHDFGEHEGVLYLVMELLDGLDLSRLLEQNKQHPLDVADVLDIAGQVASALAYTHDQGIVHRDLKPANVVRLPDGTVKICDFGIARPGDATVSSAAQLTVTGIAMGTPHYMSPEQIAGTDVDHRSDLYSLGCVLYELSTGVPPFDLDDAWAVLVGHRDTPPKPPRALRPDLPGGLEDVVLDLLAKDPGQRPQHAGELVRRIAAVRPGSRPTAVHGFAPLPAWTRGMRVGSRAGGHRPPPLTAPAPLSGRWTRPPAPPPAGSASPAQLDELADRHRRALDLGRLGRWEQAAALHRAVAQEREALLGADHPDTLTSRYETGFALGRLGRTAQALRELEQVAAGRLRTLGADHHDTLAVRQECAYALGRLGRHTEAHQEYEAVLAAVEEAMGADHPETLRCRHNLAFNLSRLGRLDEAHRTAAAVAASRTAVLGPEHPDTLASRHEVGYTLGRLGRWEDALDVCRQVADARSRVLGPAHPDTLAARYETGVGLGRLGRSAEALELYRELALVRTRTLGPHAPETLRARHGYGVNLGRLGRWEDALTEAGDVCAARERVLGPDHPDTLVSRRETAVALGWLGRWEEALDVYRQVTRARERVLGPGHPDALTSRSDEAHCLEQLGHGTEAVELYRQVATLRRGSASFDV